MYTPNFSDKRVRTRIQTALGFSLAVMSDSTPRQWSTRYIDKHFGQYQTDLSKYLRSILLIETKNHWSITNHQCKEYILNRNGCDYIYNRLHGHTDLSWFKWLQHNDISIYDKSNIRGDNSMEGCDDIRDIRDDRNDGDLEEDNSISQLIPYCITSLTNPIKRRYDRQLVTFFIEKEYGDQLKSHNFEYDDKSDRLWHPLQSVKREFKSNILANSGLIHQYDIEACAPTLILQYSYKCGLDLYLRSLNQYLNNKTELRKCLANKADVPVKKIKVLINALFCGARLGNNTQFQLSHLFDHDKERIEYLKQSRFLNGLKSDIKTCWSYIEETYPTVYKKDCNGNNRKVPMSSKFKWSIYFKLERTILNSVRDYLDSTDNSYFLEHDGWTCKNEIDLVQLRNHIKESTGYNINLDHQVININDDRSDDNVHGHP